MTDGSFGNTHTADRRPISRRRVLLPGLIVYANEAQTCDCTLRDLTPGGALLIVPHYVQLPHRFHLINIRDAVAYKARLVWIKGQEIGVSFESVISLSGNTDLPVQRLKKLWLAKAAR
jgi:hypothetical protein